MNKFKQKSIFDETILKLNSIFKKGYLPSRKNQSYKYITQSGIVVAELSNCLEHACFNLTNKQFDEYNINFLDANAFCGFFSFNLPLKVITNRICAFIKSTGLNITPCKPNMNMKSNQWKIAIYYDAYEIGDYHILREEDNGYWSSKAGSEDFLEKFKYLPEKFRNSYDFYGTYQITNPFVEVE